MAQKTQRLHRQKYRKDTKCSDHTPSPTSLCSRGHAKTHPSFVMDPTLLFGTLSQAEVRERETQR